HVLVFLAPAVLLYTLFMVIPLINSLRLSFFEIGNHNQQSFAGLQNYIKLFSDSNFAPFFWRALRNNFVFFAIHMLVQNPIGLLLAALLAEGGRIRNFFRTVIFMPTVLSVVIIGFIWQLILNPLWGVAQSMLKAVGLGAWFGPWLGKPETALVTVALISVWQSDDSVLCGIDRYSRRINGSRPRRWRDRLGYVLAGQISSDPADRWNCRNPYLRGQLQCV